VLGLFSWSATFDLRTSGTVYTLKCRAPYGFRRVGHLTQRHLVGEHGGTLFLSAIEVDGDLLSYSTKDYWTQNPSVFPKARQGKPEDEECRYQKYDLIAYT
jgi:hypothetical protein